MTLTAKTSPPFALTPGARLRRARQAAGLSPAQLATQIGLRDRRLDAVESGEEPLEGRALRWVEAQEMRRRR